MKLNPVVQISVVPLIVNGLNGASGPLAHVIVMAVADAVHGQKELWVVDIRRNNRSSNILSLAVWLTLTNAHMSHYEKFCHWSLELWEKELNSIWLDRPAIKRQWVPHFWIYNSSSIKFITTTRVTVKESACGGQCPGRDEQVDECKPDCGLFGVWTGHGCQCDDNYVGQCCRRKRDETDSLLEVRFFFYCVI